MKLARRYLPVVASAVLFVLGWKLIVVVGQLPAVPAARAGDRSSSGWCARWRRARWRRTPLATLVEIFWGFVVGASSALVVGYLLARSALAERLISPYLVAAQATPILALAPLLALWFGTGLLSKVVDLRADRLLPGGGLDDGRHPLGRRAAARARPQPARDALAGLPPPRAAGRAAVRSWAGCASA